jgi:uncharacterized membrane protein YfcA
MALLGFSAAVARPGALWMNCLVAGIASWRFHAAGFFDRRVFLPLAAASVPMAWLGSQLHFQDRTAALLLGISLALAGWFLGRSRRESSAAPPRPVALPLAFAAGGGLGLLAGATGIGGGVFLTPLLIFLGWTPAKTAGGISALFIFVNSVSGLVGLGSQAFIWQPVFIIAIAAGTAGALLGTQLGVNRWPPAAFRRALAMVLWIAAAKLLFTGN